MKLSSLFVTFAGLLVVGCGSGSKRPVTPQCQLASDCSDPLICVQGYCVKACAQSRDCPSGERCINTELSAGVTGTSCQPTEKAMCHFRSDCISPLVCATDLQCRNQCQTDVDCPGGVNGAAKCTATSKLCVDPATDKDYDSASNELKSFTSSLHDGGAGSGGGGAAGGGSGMGGGSGTAGSAGNAGTGGAGGKGGTAGGGAQGGTSGSGGKGAGGVGATCPTQFPTIVAGDANPQFTSGVGVRSGDKIYVFSGYVDAGIDGGVPGNAIYLQTFSQSSGASLGPPVSLLTGAAGMFFAVYDVAVAPTGEIALLHGSGTTSDGFSTLLYASFLTTAGAGDGGVAGLRVQRTVQVESVHYAFPHVIWATSANAFVASWKYATTNWFIRVKKFLVDGRLAGGDTNVVPTPAGINNDQAWDDGQVSSSGNLFAAAYRDYNSGRPFLTLLDGDGVQVGDIVKVAESPTVGHWTSVGGTSMGFAYLYNNGATVYADFIPTTGMSSVLADGGVPDAGGDGGAAPSFATFNLSSTAGTAHMVSDDMGGMGGVGAVLLESNGASFVYITADGTRRMATGTVISSSAGGQVTLANYQGSFSLSLYDRSQHVTQVAVSGCLQ